MTTKIIIRKPGLNGFKYSLFNEAGVWFANALSMAEIRSYYAYELRHGMIELVKDFEKPVDVSEIEASHMAIVKMTEEIIKALVSDPEEQIAALPFHDQEEETYTEEIHDDEELEEIFYYREWKRLNDKKDLPKGYIYCGYITRPGIGHIMFYTDTFDYYIYTPDYIDGLL